jgi:putative transposase
MVDAKAVIEAWRQDYNTVRPHSALDGRTPDQFAQASKGARRLSPPRPEDLKNPDELTLSV